MLVNGFAVKIEEIDREEDFFREQHAVLCLWVPLREANLQGWYLLFYAA